VTHQPKVLVVGDFLWDRYWCATTSRLSAEAPIPVCKVEKTFMVPGGAGNVQANLEALGAHVKLATGDGTIIKNRLMVSDTQVARWDENDQLTELLVTYVREGLAQADAVVIADYCKGTIGAGANTNRILDAIEESKLPVFIDTKRDPNFFNGLNATFFPNKAEHLKFFKQYMFKNGVFKCGAEGISDGEQTFPSWVKVVRSTCGAGDSVVAGFVYAELTGHSNPLAFANACAAVVCEKPYTAVANVGEVLDRLEEHKDVLPTAA
jgi:bifunctional ADP-heptose synthase (sugar kinase/adenylyltransferase)